MYYAALDADTTPTSLTPPPDMIREATPLCSVGDGRVWQIELAVQGEDGVRQAEEELATFARQNGVQAVRQELYTDHSGDVNADGSVDAKDALACLKTAVGKQTPATLDEWYNACLPDENANVPPSPDAVCALRILKRAVR